MDRRKQQVFLVLIFLFCAVVFARENQVNEDKEKKLREEILAVYKAKGEQGLLDFVKKQGDKISNQLIVDFAKAGLEERKEEWLKICEIMVEEKKDEKTLADVYYNMGKYFRLTSKNGEAIVYFEKALSIYVILNDTVGQGNVHLEKGAMDFLNGEILSAMDIYSKALFLFQKAGDFLGQGNVYINKGQIYFYNGDITEALEMYKKAMVFFEKVRYLKGQGNVCYLMGKIYSRIGNNSMVLDMYEKALNFFEKSKDYLGQGSVYWDKGNFYFKTRGISNALKMYDKAMIFFEIAKTPHGQGKVYWSKGDLYSITGEISKAIEMYDKALVFLKKTGVPVSLGNVYLSKGIIFSNTGEYLKALKMFENSQTFFEKAGSITGQGNVYLMKGDIYLKTGNYSSALKMYDKALAFYVKQGCLLGQGNIYWRKGDVYLNTDGNSSKTLWMYDKALVFFKKMGDILNQGNVYLSKGNIYLKMSDFPKAIEMYSIAIYFYEKAGAPQSQGDVYHFRGDIYLKTGEYSKALEMYKNALDLYKKIGAIESESYSLYGTAMVLAKQGKKDEALSLFEKGISDLEKVRKRTAFSGMKGTYMEKVYYQYEEITAFLLENNCYEKGFKYAESMKSRVFFDRLSEGLESLNNGISPDLKQIRDKLVSKLSIISKEISKATGNNDEKKVKELKDQYRKVEGEFEELLIKIRLKNPLYASVQYPEPVSIQDLQEKVLKKDELLLRYFISTDNIYVFLISKEDFKVITLKVTAKDVKEIVEQYLISVEENNHRRMKEYGKTLYQTLFKPLESWIKNREEIIIVPDGQLATIPFESFVIDEKRSGRPVYLLEKYRIKYIQGASVLSILREHYKRESTTRRFIGFGDPVYDYESFKQGKPEKGSMKILPTEDPSRPAAATKEAGKLRSWEAGKKHENCVRFSACSEIMVRKKIAENPHHRIDTTVTEIKCCNKNKKLNDCSTENTENGRITTHQSPLDHSTTLPLTDSAVDEIMEIHRSRYARAGGIMDRLPASGEEVNAIAELFKKQEHQAVVYEREKATEEKAKSSDIREFDYIHFSCHGILGEGFQCLVLSQILGSTEDGFLTLNEIMNCDYHAKLVVLSACRTGKGKMERAEGVTGLTRAVMYAGTPAVIASLWDVDDKATKELMVRFYRYMLEENLSKEEALRKAKLDLIKSKKYASPVHWSAFVMYGE
jgi:CHAT domain-containing protein/tetratricopeptide (TPR) repeat protein